MRSMGGSGEVEGKEGASAKGQFWAGSFGLLVAMSVARRPIGEWVAAPPKVGMGSVGGAK